KSGSHRRPGRAAARPPAPIPCPEGSQRSKCRDQTQVDLALERRATRLEAVVDADHSARRLEPHAEPDAVLLHRVEPGAAAIDRSARSHPGMIPEQERALGPAQEPAPLEARKRETIHVVLLLVVAAKRGRAADHVALVVGQDALRAEPPGGSRLEGELPPAHHAARPLSVALERAPARGPAPEGTEPLVPDDLSGAQRHARAAARRQCGLERRALDREQRVLERRLLHRPFGLNDTLLLVARLQLLPGSSHELHPTSPAGARVQRVAHLLLERQLDTERSAEQQRLGEAGPEIRAPAPARLPRQREGPSGAQQVPEVELPHAHRSRPSLHAECALDPIVARLLDAVDELGLAPVALALE